MGLKLANMIWNFLLVLLLALPAVSAAPGADRGSYEIVKYAGGKTTGAVRESDGAGTTLIIRIAS